MAKDGAKGFSNHASNMPKNVPKDQSAHAESGTKPKPRHRQDTPWFDAVRMVLEAAKQAMDTADIAEEIARRGLRTNLGDNPRSLVATTLSTEISSKKENSAFMRIGRGEYILRRSVEATTTAQPDAEELPVPIQPSAPSIGAITSFGMYWRRENVHWTANVKLLGRQQAGADPIDFADQMGVYLLHDREKIIYVGRITDRRLGKRLFEHTNDRLGGRWDRFSWFGILEPTNAGLKDSREQVQFSLESSVIVFEALLIETLEPPLNRKRGDDLKDVEYLQVIDPIIKKKETLAIIDNLKAQLGD